MADDFDPSNAVAVTDTPEGHQPVSGEFNVDNAVPIESTDKGISPYDAFKASAPENKTNTGLNQDRAPSSPSSSNKGQSKEVSKPVGSNEVKPTAKDYPHVSFLNATLDSVAGATWNTLIKPITGKDDKYVDQYLDNLNKEHPIASVIGGSAPFVASAPLFTEALIPKLWARLSLQFGGIGFLNALGQVRTEESKRNTLEKASTVVKETAKQAAAGPVFAKAQLLKIAERPFATALAQSGVITGGVGAMNTFFGDNVAEAFKQSGILGVVNMVFHAPHLAKTVIGRASLAKLSTDTGVKIDPDSSNLPEKINEAVKVIEKEDLKLTQDQIISATVKLPGGAQIHGASHEDALEKVGLTKDTAGQYEAGFTVMDLNGKTRFITREESKQAPFNLPNGHSEDVQGLNESKFMTPPDLKIVNPETLENISGAYVHNDPLDISFGKNDKLTSKKIRQEFSGVKNSQIVHGNQLADKIKQLVPDKEERQALFWYKAAEGNTDHLLEMLSEESMKPYEKQVKKAFNLSPNAMKALDVLNQYYEEAGNIATEIGTIRDVRENYMNRIYKPEPPQDYVKTETRSGIKQSTSHSKRRVYDNEFDAVMGGKEFATTDVADALSIHNEEMARVNTARKLADKMAEVKLGAWRRPENIPEGWEQVGTLKKSVPLKDEKGLAIIGQDGNQVVSQSVFVAPKGIANGLKAISEPNFVARIDALRNLQQFQGLVKTVDLAYSFFHHLSMAAQVLYQGGVRTFLQSPHIDRLIKADSFLELEQDFAKHTGMTSKVEANRDILRKLVQHSDSIYSKIENLPGVKQYLTGAEKGAEFLFGKIQRYLKVSDYGHKITEWVSKNPEATNEEVKLAKTEIAKQINSVYGGLNWEAMGVTRSNLALLRLGLLAPDWTISNVALLKYAIGKEGQAGSLSRKHILTALAGGMIATEGLNVMLTGHTTDKNKKGHALEVEVSPNVYVSLLRGGIGDISKFGSMVAESGLSGVSRFAQGKLSPWARTLIGLLNNVQYTGRAIAKKSEGPLLGTYHVMAYILGSAGPVPFGLSNTAAYLTDKTSEKTPQGAFAVLSGLGRYSKTKDKQDTNKEMTPYRQKELAKEAKMTDLQKKTKHMSFDKVSEMYKSAKDSDKPELERIMNKKRLAKKKIRNWTTADEEMYKKMQGLTND